MYTQSKNPEENKYQYIINFFVPKKSNGKNENNFEILENKDTQSLKGTLLNVLNENSDFKNSIFPKPKNYLKQRNSYTTLSDFFKQELPHLSLSKSVSSILKENIEEAEAQLTYVEFLHKKGAQPMVDLNEISEKKGKFVIVFDRENPQVYDTDFFVATIIHELIHISNFKKYQKHNPKASDTDMFMNLHVPEMENDDYIESTEGLYANFSAKQINCILAQKKILEDNWEKLYNLLLSEKNVIKNQYFNHLKNRIGYGEYMNFIENDTVTFDMVYYMEVKNLKNTNTYLLALKMLKEATKRRNTKGKMVQSISLH